MELYQQIIIDGLQRGELSLTLSADAGRWLEGRCYQTLMKIKSVLEDEELEDEECFLRIEGILAAFEEMGAAVAGRHDCG